MDIRESRLVKPTIEKGMARANYALFGWCAFVGASVYAWLSNVSEASQAAVKQEIVDDGTKTGLIATGASLLLPLVTELPSWLTRGIIVGGAGVGTFVLNGVAASQGGEGFWPTNLADTAERVASAVVNTGIAGVASQAFIVPKESHAAGHDH